MRLPAWRGNFENGRTRNSVTFCNVPVLVRTGVGAHTGWPLECSAEERNNNLSVLWVQYRYHLAYPSPFRPWCLGYTHQLATLSENAADCRRQTQWWRFMASSQTWRLPSCTPGSIDLGQPTFGFVSHHKPHVDSSITSDCLFWLSVIYWFHVWGNRCPSYTRTKDLKSRIYWYNYYQFVLS